MRQVEYNDTYPIGVRYKGIWGFGDWQVWNLLTGEIYRTVQDGETAHSWAEFISWSTNGRSKDNG